MEELLSTSEVSEPERLTYWRDALHRAYGPLQVVPLDESPFFGMIRARRLGPVLLSEVTSSATIVNRPERSISRSGEEHVKAIFHLNGESLISQDGRTAHLRPVEWTIVDCALPYTVVNRTDRYVHWVIQIPRDTAGLVLPNVRGVTACTLSCKTGLGRVVFEFVESIWQEMTAIAPATGHQVASALVDLLGATLNETLYCPKPMTKSQMVALLAVKSFIQENLRDPLLTVDSIASALGFSKSYLHHLFRAENTTLTRYIWDLRLHKCAMDLRNPLCRHRTITDIAFSWGFSDSAHFCRLFKERFGVPPRTYRCTNALVDQDSSDRFLHHVESLPPSGTEPSPASSGPHFVSPVASFVQSAGFCSTVSKASRRKL